MLVKKKFDCHVLWPIRLKHTHVANLSGATITSFSFPLFRFSFLRLKFQIQHIAKHNFDLVKKHKHIFGEEFYYAIDLIL